MKRNIAILKGTLRLLVAVFVAGAWGSATVQADSITRYEYDSAGQVTRKYVTDAAGEVLADVRTSYDELGRAWRVEQIDVDGGPSRVTEIGFDHAGNTTVRQRSREDPLAPATTTYDYDWLNRQTRMVDAAEAVTDVQHNDLSQVTKVTDSVGLETSYFYDPAGRLNLEQQRHQGTWKLETFTLVDSLGRRLNEGRRGYGTTTWGPVVTRHRWVYDALGRVTREVQVADPIDFWAEDPAVDRVADYTYDGASDRVATETVYRGDPAVAFTTTNSYDAIGRLTLTTDPAGNTETIVSYTPEGQVEERHIDEPPLPLRRFRTVYDSLGRTVCEYENDLLVASFAYDALGRRKRATDARGIVTSFGYNAFGELTRAVEDVNGAARTTEYEFDLLGHVTLQRAFDDGPTPQVTTLGYDAVGRRTSVTHPDGTFEEYRHDAAGRRTQRLDPRGLVVDYVLDWRGQVGTTTVDGQLVEDFDYTPLGWLERATNATGDSTAYYYDAFGQVPLEQQTVAGRTWQIEHAYDQTGARTRLTYPPDVGYVLTYKQDALGQVQFIKRYNQTLAEYTYAGPHVLERAVDASVVFDSGGPVVRQTYGRDDFRRVRTLTQQVEADSETATILAEYDLTYDDVGNLTRSLPEPGTLKPQDAYYRYDDLNRLTRVEDAAQTAAREVFDLDVLGNRDAYTASSGAATGYDSDISNKYAEITPPDGVARSPDYDNAGNLLRNEADYVYEYDYASRLTRLRDPAGEVLVTYTYDAEGRRIQETRGTQSTTYVYDGDTVLAEFDAVGSVLRSYVHGTSRADEPLAVSSFSGQRIFLHDSRGSVVGLVNSKSEVTEAIDYDAYGLPVERRGGDLDGNRKVDAFDLPGFLACRSDIPEVPQEAVCTDADLDGDGDSDLNDFLAMQNAASEPSAAYLFTGQRLDFDVRDPDGTATGQPGQPVLALYHYRARAFDPWHGRFLQRDPLPFPESSNLYEYALSNPVNRIDPSGLTSFDEDVDVLILDLTAHRFVTLQYLSGAFGFAEGGLRASVASIEFYLSLRSPLAALGLSARDFFENPTILGFAAAAADLFTLRLPLFQAAQVGPYVTRWMARYSRIQNKGGEAVERALQEVAHHAIPKFLGGFTRQITSGRISVVAHDFFHAALRDELYFRGVPRRMLGGTGQSRTSWARYFDEFPGSAEDAIDAIREASRRTDQRFGTNLLGDVEANLSAGLWDPQLHRVNK